MSLRKETKADAPLITGTAHDFSRLEELFKIMTDVGVTRMSTSELEEWSYLMARSLEGKGDQSY